MHQNTAQNDKLNYKLARAITSFIAVLDDLKRFIVSSIRLLLLTTLVDDDLTASPIEGLLM
jgi:hypothetical protein